MSTKPITPVTIAVVVSVIIGGYVIYSQSKKTHKAKQTVDAHDAAQSAAMHLASGEVREGGFSNFVKDVYPLPRDAPIPHESDRRDRLSNLNMY
jgi:hypothetical protein